MLGELRPWRALARFCAHLPRRRLSIVLPALVAVGLVPAAAQTPPAPAIPSTVRLLVGFPVGGGVDAAARIYADALHDVLKTTVVVENRPGAGGAIAAQAAIAAPTSQPTLLYAADHQVSILRHIMKNPGFDADRDLVPLGRITVYEMCLGVHSSVPAKTLPEYMAAAKTNTTMANYAVPSSGSSGQFIGHALATHFGVKLNPVPYRGGAPAVADLAAGQIPAAVLPCDTLATFVQSGHVRILGVASDKRSARMPDVPAMGEFGVPIPGTLTFTGVYAPRSMDSALIARLAAATREAFNKPGLAAKIDATGAFAAYANGQELAGIGARASAFWAEQVKSSGFASTD